MNFFSFTSKKVNVFEVAKPKILLLHVGISLFGFLNRWNDSMGTEIETPAYESGKKLLKKFSWDAQKHTYKK